MMSAWPIWSTVHCLTSTLLTDSSNTDLCLNTMEGRNSMSRATACTVTTPLVSLHRCIIMLLYRNATYCTPYLLSLASLFFSGLQWRWHPQPVNLKTHVSDSSMLGRLHHSFPLSLYSSHASHCLSLISIRSTVRRFPGSKVSASGWSGISRRHPAGWPWPTRTSAGSPMSWMLLETTTWDSAVSCKELYCSSWGPQNHKSPFWILLWCFEIISRQYRVWHTHSCLKEKFAFFHSHIN